MSDKFSHITQTIKDSACIAFNFFCQSTGQSLFPVNDMEEPSLIFKIALS